MKKKKELNKLIAGYSQYLFSSNEKRFPKKNPF